VSLHAHEKTAHAHSMGNKAIGLTIAVLAVLSASVTVLMSHTSTDKQIPRVSWRRTWNANRRL
jgi:hypothetical protein